MNSSYQPCARRDGLRVQVIANETMIYDTESDRASVLNPTAAFVWKNSDGTRTVSEIASAMSESFQIPADTQLVWYALEQLSKKNLLLERAPVPSEYSKLTRRALLSKAGLVGAALAIPVVISMVAPAPAHAQSCGLPLGAECGSSEDCCSGCCVGTCQVEAICF